MQHRENIPEKTNRQTGNIQKKKTYQLGMQHREYLEVVQLAEVQHRVDFDTLGAHQAFKITYMQEVVDEAAAEETNEHTQGRKINNTYNVQSSEIEPGTEGNTRTATREHKNLAQRGTQRIEGGVRERKREIYL